MSNVGPAIEMARRARGWTQEETAKACDITQAALSRYENELREPDPESLARIASVLGITPELLHRAGGLRGAMAVDAHMRRRKTAPPRIWRQLEARLNMLRVHADQLREQVGIAATLEMPSFDPVDVEPGEAARLLRMQWRMPIGPVRGLIDWIEAAGCIVVEEDFQTSRVDALSQWIADQPVVLLNVSVPTDRKRLTLAHELGHLCLHRTEVTDSVESDANSFASELLMPAETIRPHLRNATIGRLVDLKREWGVSIQALIERAFQLGTITNAQRASMYKRLSVLGWRTREPASDELRPEEPRLARHIGNSMEAAGLTQAEIARLAGYSEQTLMNPFAPSQRGLRAV